MLIVGIQWRLYAGMPGMLGVVLGRRSGKRRRCLGEHPWHARAHAGQRHRRGGTWAKEIPRKSDSEFAGDASEMLAPVCRPWHARDRQEQNGCGGNRAGQRMEISPPDSLG